jgi:hypothetical protein
LSNGCDSVTDTKSVAITAPSLVQPMDNDTGVSLTPTFKWTGTADKFQIATSSTFNTILYACDVSGTQYGMPSGVLQSQNKYYWRAGRTSNNTVYWCATIFSFKTQ